MKTKILVYLILGVFLLNSCSNVENDMYVYEGVWSGQYGGNVDSGNWSIRIDTNKTVVGTFTSIQSSNSYPVIGVISENGVLNATISMGEITGEFSGHFMDNTAFGTWTNNTEDDSGTWNGTKL